MKAIYAMFALSLISLTAYVVVYFKEKDYQMVEIVCTNYFTELNTCQSFYNCKVEDEVFQVRRKCGNNFVKMYYEKTEHGKLYESPSYFTRHVFLLIVSLILFAFSFPFLIHRLFCRS